MSRIRFVGKDLLDWQDTKNLLRLLLVFGIEVNKQLFISP